MQNYVVTCSSMQYDCNGTEHT